MIELTVCKKCKKWDLFISISPIIGYKKIMDWCDKCWDIEIDKKREQLRYSKILENR